MDNREITEKVRNGLTYDVFMVDWTEKNALPMKGLDKAARRMRYYSIYNLERQGRVDEMYAMRDEFRDLVLSLPGPQLWMFITEDWCVDSAYSLPIVRDAAALRAAGIARVFTPKDYDLTAIIGELAALVGAVNRCG